MACSPVLRTPRAGGGTPLRDRQLAAASMLFVRRSTWKGPGPLCSSARAVTPGPNGCASVTALGPSWNTAMSALITVPRSIFGFTPSTFS